MAGPILLEKRPGSWRLDHPFLQDVLDTTYAKGVITNFKMTPKSECDPLLFYPGKFSGDDQVDPFRVKSLVKVKIEDRDESDWLPLFYCPKAHMWDDTDMIVSDIDGNDRTVNPGVLATNLNLANQGIAGAPQWFEKAWMSFRFQDEVVVLLQKGVPVAVIGFADGVPRVGEGVFLLNVRPMSGPIPDPGASEQPRYVRIDEMKLNAGGATGPDGLDLKLVQAVPILFDYYYEIVGISYTVRIYYKVWSIILGPKLIVMAQCAGAIAAHGALANIYIALATQENIDAVLPIAQAVATPELTIGGIFINPFENQPNFFRQSDTLSMTPGASLNDVFQVGINDMWWSSVYVRPHTKTELQAADMWPGQ